MCSITGVGIASTYPLSSRSRPWPISGSQISSRGTVSSTGKRIVAVVGEERALRLHVVARLVVHPADADDRAVLRRLPAAPGEHAKPSQRRGGHDDAEKRAFITPSFVVENDFDGARLRGLEERAGPVGVELRVGDFDREEELVVREALEALGEEDGWWCRGSLFRPSIPKTALSAEKRTVTSNMIGIIDGSVPGGLPPTMSG